MMVVETSPRAPALRPLSTCCSTEICSVAIPHLSWLLTVQAGRCPPSPGRPPHQCRTPAVTCSDSAPPSRSRRGPLMRFSHLDATVLASICSIRNDFCCEGHTLRLVHCVVVIRSIIFSFSSFSSVLSELLVPS